MQALSGDKKGHGELVHRQHPIDGERAEHEREGEIFVRFVMVEIYSFDSHLQVEKLDGWPENICKQCLTQVSR